MKEGTRPAPDRSPRRNRRALIALLAAVVLGAAACAVGSGDATGNSVAASPTEDGAATQAAVTTATAAAAAVAALTDTSGYEAGFDEADLDADEGGSGATLITLTGTAAAVEGSGVVVDGATVTITAAGTYRLTGTLDDGQVVVDAGSEDTVRLVLAGVEITSSTGAPIYAVQSGRVIITLAGGTDNFLADAASYVYPDAATTEPSAAVFSNDDLTINGEGALTVTASCNDGIASDDDLKVAGGNITVVAADDGLRGKDSVAVGGGALVITAGGDGIKASNDEDPEQGYVVIESGSLAISAGGDGIQAETALVVRGGDLTVRTGSESGAAGAQGTESTKGLKAGTEFLVTGGSFDIAADDDALHSDGAMTIAGGTFLLATSDDGLHAETSLDIDGGSIDVTACYEGLESAAITITGGDIHITATDDGVNTVGAGTTASAGAGPGGPGGQGGPGAESGDYPLTITGGYLYIDALGDGIDANGPVTMTGGTVVINGPTANNNGALDFVSFDISGGLLVAVGSAGMAMAPDEGSAQPTSGLSFRSTLSAGTMIHVAAEDGAEILTFAPTKEFTTLVLSSPDLVVGATYSVYLGGSSTGVEADGLYSGGTYTAGELAGTFTM